MIPGLIITGRKVALNPGNQEALFALFGLLTLFALLYFLLIDAQAYTRIDSQGIHYKYFPFVRSWKLIPWSDITQVKITPISPLTDFGGWGYRWGKKGKGIILSGDRAIVISRTKGKNFVLTTQQEQSALRELQHYAPEKLE